MAAKRGNARRQKRDGGERTVEGWRANALEIDFSADDVDLLDNVITVVPILRIVAAIGKEARKRGLRYPVATAADLARYLGSESLLYGRHRVDPESIGRTMPDTWFPIAHEGELLSRVHLALLRCEMEAAQHYPRPAIHNR